MNGIPEMHDVQEKLKEIEKWVQRERMRLALRAFAFASVFFLIARTCKDSPIFMWVFYTIAVVMFGLGVCDIAKLISRKKG